MGTLSRVGTGQKVKMLRVVLALVLVAVAWGQTCLLRNIPVKTDLDERRLIGRWYEMKWHAGSAARLARWNNKYSDLYIDLNILGHHGSPNIYNYMMHMGFQVNEVYYDIVKGTCIQNQGTWTRVDPSKPSKYKDTLRPDYPDAQAWIMDTDYDSYIIKFACLRVSGEYCQLSEVQIFTKSPDYSMVVLRKAEMRLRELLINNPCISYTYVIPVVPHSTPAKCATVRPVPTPLPFPGYGYNFFDGSMGMLGGMMHPDLVVPMKEKLIAEKEKLISEKAYFLIMKEKLQLEIQRLRTGRAGGPKA